MKLTTFPATTRLQCFPKVKKISKLVKKNQFPAPENFMLPLKNLLNNPWKIISYRGKPTKIQHLKKAPLAEKKISVKLMNFYPVQMKFQSEKNVVTKTLENQ